MAKEMDILKMQRADNWRELTKLKEINDMRVREASDLSERLKQLDYELTRNA